MENKENTQNEKLRVDDYKDVLYFAEMLRAYVYAGLFRDFVILVTNALVFLLSINVLNNLAMINPRIVTLNALAVVPSAIGVLLVLIIQDENKKYVQSILRNADDEILNKHEKKLKILDKIAFIATVLGLVLLIISAF